MPEDDAKGSDDRLCSEVFFSGYLVNVDKHLKFSA